MILEEKIRRRGLLTITAQRPCRQQSKSNWTQDRAVQRLHDS
jgi:hypothetical protein